MAVENDRHWLYVFLSFISLLIYLARLMNITRKEICLFFFSSFFRYKNSVARSTAQNRAKKDPLEAFALSANIKYEFIIHQSPSQYY